MLDRLVLVFGATGAIGSSICKWFAAKGYKVIAVSRAEGNASSDSKITWMVWNNDENAFPLIEKNSIHAVIWAQGTNFSDDIYSLNLSEHQSMYEANVIYIISSLQALLKKELLAPLARLCVISSIWQNLAKQNKLSYCITKSALQGMVQSLAIDLGRTGYIINAVLPGALDTPMTRENLNTDQLRTLEQMTPLGSLPDLSDVCNLVGFLCSPDNTGITGQFISADRGFSNARIF